MMDLASANVDVLQDGSVTNPTLVLESNAVASLLLEVVTASLRHILQKNSTSTAVSAIAIGLEDPCFVRIVILSEELLLLGVVGGLSSVVATGTTVAVVALSTDSAGGDGQDRDLERLRAFAIAIAVDSTGNVGGDVDDADLDLEGLRSRILRRVGNSESGLDLDLTSTGDGVISPLPLPLPFSLSLSFALSLLISFAPCGCCCDCDCV